MQRVPATESPKQLSRDLKAAAAAAGPTERSDSKIQRKADSKIAAPARGDAPASRIQRAGADGGEGVPLNKTGLPDQLKTGIENLSGYSMNDVKVHYNSSKPAQLNALAYADGNNIHIAPGQEKHLPHEGWHVVQQKQGRVQATLQL